MGGGGWGEEGWSKRRLGDGDSVGDEMEAGWEVCGLLFF